MTQDKEFNLPDFVRSADHTLLDANAEGAFSYGGYRLDNPAAIWCAAADMRKSAGSDMGAHLRSMITQACDLFGITDDMFIEKKAAVDDSVITITDGTNTASFCILDQETLNAAADSVIEKRASLPYAFAHDCAQTVKIMANHLGLKLDTDKEIAINKIAGEGAVDYERGKSALLHRARKAEQFHMQKAANILNKLASMCSTDCAPELAKIFVAAADEFDQSLSDLHKTASAITKHAEDDFFLSKYEEIRKEASDVISIDGYNKIQRSKLTGIPVVAMSKWASELGYTIKATDDPETIVATVGKMPKFLREEFVSTFA